MGIIGDILGSVTDIWSDSKRQQEARKVRRMNEDLAYNAIQIRTRDAKAAGLHPLAALGISPASVPSYGIQGVGRSGLSKFGQSIGNVIDYVANKKDKDELSRIRLEREKEELKNAKLKNIGLANDIENFKKVVVLGEDPLDQTFGIPSQADTPQGAGPTNGKAPIGQSPSVTYEKGQLPYSRQLGQEAGIGPGWRYSIQPDGGVNMYVSEKDQEAVESDVGAKADLLITRGGLYGKGHGSAYAGLTRFGDKALEELRKWRPKNPPRGYEYRYNTFRGKFYLRKIGKGKYGSRFFDGNVRPDISNNPLLRVKGRNRIYNYPGSYKRKKIRR